MFAISGQFRGRNVLISWDDGKVSGDEEFVRALEQLAEEEEYVEVIGMGKISTNSHLSKPLAASVLMGQLFDTIFHHTGEFPEFPEVPPDAVI